MTNLPTLKHDNDTWRVLGQGTKLDGKTYCHLASLTAGRQQRNGWMPAQMGDWIDDTILAEAIAA